MNKVIKNKLYNTQSATQLADWDNGYPRMDPLYVKENLYIKKTGEYFIHAYGGAATQYAEQSGNNQFTAGEILLPITFEEAENWAKEKLQVEVYDKIFGINPGTENKEEVGIYLKIPAVLDKRMRFKLQREKDPKIKTIGNYIISLIKKDLNDNEEGDEHE
ncbi:hypothetical protein [Acetobacterium sp.]|uniref:hypothetical protein n=1 Tax=Acetobacterium sp. TaxID=1872094 RepID=UPI0027292269|nr:hypothetical protein [Acetobacterium sp.]MDO9491268.1 hypothetical protein [Acetobacterium sp.]